MREYRLHLYRLLSILLPEMSCNSIKRGMLRWCGATVGKNCRICSSALISGSGNLTIGDEVYIGSKVVIRAAEGSSIHIGNYAILRSIPACGQQLIPYCPSTQTNALPVRELAKTSESEMAVGCVQAPLLLRELKSVKNV